MRHRAIGDLALVLYLVITAIPLVMFIVGVFVGPTANGAPPVVFQLAPIGCIVFFLPTHLAACTFLWLDLRRRRRPAVLLWAAALLFGGWLTVPLYYWFRIRPNLASPDAGISPSQPAASGTAVASMRPIAVTSRPSEGGYRYPLRTRLRTLYALLVWLWFFLTGAYFLVTDPPRELRAWIPMTVFVILFGIGVYFLTRQQLQLMSVLYAADDGLHVWRLNSKVMTIHWFEIDQVRDRGRWGDFEVRCERADKRLRVGRRLIGLDDLRSKIDGFVASRGSGTLSS